MTDAQQPDEQHDRHDQVEPVTDFDQTNGLAGNLVGDDDETTSAKDDDRPVDIGSIYTGLTGDAGDDAPREVGSDGEEPI